MKPDEIPSTQVQEDYDQPVAYDAEGRPLYAHPPVVSTPEPAQIMTQSAAQQVVHIARAIDPIKQEISDETKQRHDASRQRYPLLDLSENEYIIISVRRHPIGLIMPLLSGVLLIAFALTILVNYSSIVSLFDIRGQFADASVVTVPILLFCVIVGLGMFIAYYVYVNNKFYLTNESVIQDVQLSLFSRHEQTVSLGNIEDASYYQQGIFQQIFNYGMIRLSTEGDETTYRFTFASNPKDQIAVLNDAVEAFKNGRPVEN